MIPMHRCYIEMRKGGAWKGVALTIQLWSYVSPRCAERCHGVEGATEPHEGRRVRRIQLRCAGRGSPGSTDLEIKSGQAVQYVHQLGNEVTR